MPWLLERRGVPGEWIHLDGKTLRRTRCQSQKLKALHVVSAWAGQTGMTLGQVAVAAKSNEITAMPQLLKFLDLHEKIVTTDAMGCQKEIAQTIVAGGGDYLLAVKDNQPTLHAELQAAFAQAPAPERGPRGCIPPKTRATGGRNSARCRCCPHGSICPPRRARCGWGVLTLVMVTRVVWCEATGVESIEVSYFLSSLRPNARRIGSAIRGHWSIENGLHWVLDVVFREDARRLYDRTAAENVAFLNRLALSLLRGDTGKSSMKVKRKQAGWSIPYLAQLLGFHST